MYGEVSYGDETYGDATYGDIWSLYPLQVSFYEDAVGFTLLRLLLGLVVSPK